MVVLAIVLSDAASVLNLLMSIYLPHINISMHNDGINDASKRINISSKRVALISDHAGTVLQASYESTRGSHDAVILMFVK